MLSKAYGDKIKEIFGIPVDYQDERLTTALAERMLLNQQMSAVVNVKVIDKLAAQSYSTKLPRDRMF